MGVETFPAVLFTILVVKIPKSPRWLIQNGQIDLAKEVLIKTSPEEKVEVLIDEVSSHKSDNRENILKLKYRFPLLLTFFIAAFNQLSGINAFLYSI